MEGTTFVSGQDVRINGSINGDLFVAGATILQEGIIQRNLFGGGAETVLSGQIGGDANLQTDSLKIQDGANIAGDLNYKGENEADIGTGATIAGDTDWEFAETMDKATTVVRESRRPFMKVIWFLWSWVSALLIWFLIRIWRPAFWQNTTRPLVEQPLKTLGVGLLTLLVVSPMIILAMITVIGIPIAVILGAVYPIALYLSRIIVAVFIGQWLAKRFKRPELHNGIWLVLLGLIILGVLQMLPFIGFLSSLLIVMAGLGSLVMAHHRATPETANVQTELDL